MDDKILHRAVEFFGADAQKWKAIEELAELMEALCHWSHSKDTASHVAEEIADSMIMLRQLAIITGTEADVEQWTLDKMAALAKKVGML